jgi:predicted nucleic acid-binding protein
MIKGDHITIEKYKQEKVVTVNLTYGEAFYYCIRMQLKKEKFTAIPLEILEYTLKDIENAMELLAERKPKTKDFSFVDAVVYTVAKKNNLTLVTKDFGFKGLPNVEFIEHN